MKAHAKMQGQHHLQLEARRKIRTRVTLFSRAAEGTMGFQDRDALTSAKYTGRGKTCPKKAALKVAVKKGSAAWKLKKYMVF